MASLRAASMLLFTFVGACCFAAESDSTAVLKTLERLARAGLSRDVAVMQKLYAADYFHTNADGSVMSRADVFQSYSRPTDTHLKTNDRDEVHLTLHGRTAVVSERVTLTGTRGVNVFVSRFRVTYTLSKIHDSWIVLASHASVLEEQTKRE